MVNDDMENKEITIIKIYCVLYKKVIIILTIIIHKD